MFNKSLKSQIKFSVSVLAIASMGVMDAAVAQEADEDEIIVTARKQESTILDTPLSISAFQAEEIQEAGFANIIEISRATPGLFIESINDRNARVDLSPRFRGVTVDNSDPLLRTGSVFVDGVYVSGGIQGINSKEIERVEIIKGPQSALFGRNTFAGAINYITKQPSDDFQANLSATVATRDEYRAAGSVEGPIAGDVISARLSASYDFDGGHYINAFDPATDIVNFGPVDPSILTSSRQELGEESTWAVAGTVMVEPNDAFNLRVRATYYEDNDGPAAVARVGGFREHNAGGIPLAGGGTTETAFAGVVRAPDSVSATTSQEVYDFTLAAARAAGEIQEFGVTYDDLGGPGLKRESFRIGADAHFDISEDLRLDVLGGISSESYLFYADFDSTGSFGFNTSGARDTDDTSIEARLSGGLFDDRVDWSVGANYLDIDIESGGGFYDGVLNFWFPGIFSDRFVTGAETIGLFGTLDIAITDEFTLIMEGRYQEDEITEEAANAGLTTPISPATFTNFLPRVLLQWEPSSKTTLYANYSQGNLPGGFNEEIGELTSDQLTQLRTLNPGVGVTFDEETLENIELGWKQQFADGRAAFNLAVFNMKRSDQIFSGFQIVDDPANVNGVRTVAFTDNGATTDINGFELDGTFTPDDYTTFQGSLAWVDAKIDSFPADTGSGDFSDVFGPDADVRGQRAPRFPEWMGSFSTVHQRPIGNFMGKEGTEWFVRGDVFYSGDFYDSNTNLASIEGGTEVNLRTGLDFDDLRLEVFVTNLFGEDAPVSGNNIADTSLDVRLGSGLFDFSRESIHVAFRDKRQFGARLDWTFD